MTPSASGRAIEDLTPEWINELHERLDERGLTDCAMASADLMAFKPEGLADQVALNALKRAGWRAIRASLGGHRGRVFLRGERENVTKRTFRHQIQGKVAGHWPSNGHPFLKTS